MVFDKIGTRISQADFFKRFSHNRQDYSYVNFIHGERTYKVPAGARHQVIGSKESDRGIAWSKNGDKDFRRYDRDIVYWFNGSQAYILGSPKEDTINLDWS